jgi:hypothetical protein
MSRNPNCKERLEPLNPVTRKMDTGATGDAKRDGYTTVARRPRSGYFDDIVEVGQADRIEGIVSDFGMDEY